MQNLRISKVIAALAVLAMSAGILLHFSNRGPPKAPVQPVPPEPAGSQTPGATPHLLREAEAATSVPETQDLAIVDFGWRQVLTNQMVPPKLPHEKSRNTSSGTNAARRAFWRRMAPCATRII